MPARSPLVLALAVLLAVPLAGEAAAPVSAAAPVASVAPAPSVRAEAAPRARLSAAGLRQQVNDALTASGATIVGAAVDVQGVGQLLRRNAGAGLPPASTQKSFVALASLVRRGPGAVATTQVVRTALPTVSGALPGSLWLVAGGDPTLTAAGLRQLAQQVRASGIRTVAGDLLLDDSRYDRRVTAPGWKARWLGTEIGPLSALAVDRNAYRRDAVFLRDPAIRNALVFRDFLRLSGVTVTGTVRRAARPASVSVVASRSSAPLTDVLKTTVETSNNFYAEMLLKELGKAVRNRGTSADGLAAVRQVLPGVAVGAGADGSGLSSLDRQSPAGQVQLLNRAASSTVFAHFTRALPVACLEGTLKKRMCGTAAAGRATAKTGTLDNTRALAGYTRTANGQLVLFAFQLQGIPSGKRATDAMDRAVALLSAAR